MVRSAGIVVAFALGVLVAPADAEQAKPVYRIGTLTGAWAPNHPGVEGLKAGLKAIGLEEGRDVAFDNRFTEGNPQAAPGLVAALIQAGADLLFTTGEAYTKAAKAATQKIPIVFMGVSDPVASRLVSNIAHPGGNVTGVSSLGTDLVPKRLEVLKEIAPTVRRVRMIYPADDPTALAAVLNARRAVQLLRLELVERPVRTPEDVADALKGLRPGDGFLASLTATLNIPGAILEASLAARVPAVFDSAFWIPYGALVSYGSDYYAEGFQAARLVARILRGTPPRDLPVEGANKIELAINLKTAKTLGLSIPREILLRAERVIE